MKLEPTDDLKKNINVKYRLKFDCILPLTHTQKLVEIPFIALYVSTCVHTNQSILGRSIRAD